MVLDGVIFTIVSAVLTLTLTLTFAPRAELSPIAGGVAGSGAVVLISVLSSVLAMLAYATYDYGMHSRRGQTLGKIALRIRVVAPDGGKPQQDQLLRRALIYPGLAIAVSFLSIFGAIGALLYLALLVMGIADGFSVITDEPLRRALHDKWVGTVVVKVRKAKEESRSDYPMR
jgi:uncharacterized RDD family membrane protein YckC